MVRIFRNFSKLLFSEKGRKINCFFVCDGIYRTADYAYTKILYIFVWKKYYTKSVVKVYTIHFRHKLSSVFSSLDIIQGINVDRSLKSDLLRADFYRGCYSPTLFSSKATQVFRHFSQRELGNDDAD